MTLWLFLPGLLQELDPMISQNSKMRERQILRVGTRLPKAQTTAIQGVASRLPSVPIPAGMVQPPTLTVAPKPGVVNALALHPLAVREAAIIPTGGFLTKQI